MDGLWQAVVQGGVAIIIFVIWFFTFIRANAQYDELSKRHESLSTTLIQLLQDEQDYKSHLAGILQRLEQKLDAPVRCPLTVKKQRSEKDEAGE